MWSCKCVKHCFCHECTLSPASRLQDRQNGVGCGAWCCQLRVCHRGLAGARGRSGAAAKPTLGSQPPVYATVRATKNTTSSKGAEIGAVSAGGRLCGRRSQRRRSSSSPYTIKSHPDPSSRPLYFRVSGVDTQKLTDRTNGFRWQSSATAAARRFPVRGAGAGAPTSSPSPVTRFL